MKGTLFTGKMLHVFFLCEQIFKKGEERKGGRASNDRCYIFALRTNVFFMNGSPIRPHHPNARM